MADSLPPRVTLALTVGVLSFAFAPILVRWASEAPGLTIAVWRTCTAALVMLPGLAYVYDEVRAFGWRDWGLIIASGTALGAHFIAWIEALYYTSVASASVLATTSPVFVAVLGYVILKDRLAWPVVGGIFVAVGGATLMGLTDAGAVAFGPEAWWGNTLALSAALLVSVYLLIGRAIRQRVSWLAYLIPLYSVAALVTLGAAVGQGVPLTGYSPVVYACGIGLALGPQVLGHSAFNFALQRVPAALIGMLALLEPVGASVLAYFLFGEAPGGWSALGMVIVLGAVAFVVLYRSRSQGTAPEDATEQRGT